MDWTCACGAGNENSAKFCGHCGRPRPPAEPTGAETLIAGPMAAPPMPSPQANPVAPAEAAPSRRPTLLIAAGVFGVLALLGICIVGIVAAIAIPNFLNARERGRQRKAMADIRTIATACELYATDKGHYPLVTNPVPSGFTTATASSLKEAIGSDYCRACPVNDPWGAEYKYGANVRGSRFILICYGSDKEGHVENIPDEHVGTHCFEDDIIWADGAFVQEPEGEQKRCK